MFNNKRSPRRGGGRNSSGGHFSKRGRGGFRRGGKVLDHKLFIKKATPVEESVYTPSRKYSDMDLHPKLQKTLNFKKFEFPTEIQDKTIEQSMQGRDILGIAATGTGKTGAFLIPIIDRLLKSGKPFQTLVVVPTRELANQVEQEFLSIAHGLQLYSICLTGGTSVGRNLKRLKMFNHFVIGTPGRLIDMVERNALKLQDTEVLVLDEFDRMLDMGFIDDVKFLTSKMENIKQTMLFSATVGTKLKPTIDQLLNDPFEVMVNTGTNSSDSVEQNIIKVGRGENKFAKLMDLIEHDDFSRVLIFAETKRVVDKLNKELRGAGIKSDLIHGDKTQRAREIALEKFKKGRVDVLVATDVAARGLDIKGVSHVINYEPPKDYESYIHRIGRTGRNGKAGHALTFVS